MRGDRSCHAGILQPLLDEYASATRWVVGYSGGLDSHVLLHLCAALRDAYGGRVPALHALHVDHGVQSQSTAWTAHCRRVCETLSVPFHLQHAAVGESGAGVVSEERLREARYRIFESFCGGTDLLLLAHHRDDQAETVLLRLARGTGVTGLAGMPRARSCGASRLCRPLLAEPRSRLLDYAREHRLQWIEDPGNAGVDFDRNYLRNRILPQLESRWPGVSGRIARSAGHCAEAADICDERAREDLLPCEAVDAFGQSCMRLDRWRELGPARGRNLLRAWVYRRCGQRIDAHALRTVEAEIIGASDDAHGSLRIGAHVLRRFRNGLYALDADAVLSPLPTAFEISPGFDALVAGSGRITLRTAPGVRAGQRYEVRFRAPGAMCKLPNRPRKSLKKLLQELDVPPWLRDRLPLLHVDGELAAVAHLCICEPFVSRPGEASVSVGWERAAISQMFRD